MCVLCLEEDDAAVKKSKKRQCADMTEICQTQKSAPATSANLLLELTDALKDL